MDSITLTLTRPIALFPRKPSFKRPPFIARSLPEPSPAPGDGDAEYPKSPRSRIAQTLRRWLWPSGGGGGEVYLRQGGLGVALLSVTATAARAKVSPVVAQLAANPAFVSGLAAWLAAQSAKVAIGFFVERKWDPRLMFASGGMPSSHSALCTALSASVALCHGVADSLFPVCLGFSLIVMYDAIGVRRHAGMQAEVLNMIVEDLFQGHPISKRKLKELLGHTPSQVLAGALLGIAVACVCCNGCLAAT